jgi:hypothetical protein
MYSKQSTHAAKADAIPTAPATTPKGSAILVKYRSQNISAFEEYRPVFESWGDAMTT